MDKKEDDKMAVRKEDVKNMQVTANREKLIRDMTHKACDKNDEGLRRLSKS